MIHFAATLAWIISLTLASPTGLEHFKSTVSFETAAECIAAVETEKVKLEAQIKEKGLPLVISDIHCVLEQVEGFKYGPKLSEGN
jgi:hypothetical protein